MLQVSFIEGNKYFPLTRTNESIFVATKLLPCNASDMFMTVQQTLTLMRKESTGRVYLVCLEHDVMILTGRSVKATPEG